MATLGNRPEPPKDEPHTPAGLKDAVHDAFKEAKHDASTGNVSTSEAPPQPDERLGHDRRPG